MLSTLFERFRLNFSFVSRIVNSCSFRTFSLASSSADFIKDCCKEEIGGFIRYSEFYTAYVQYLKHYKRRIVSKKEFIQALEREGFEIRRTSKKINNLFVSDRYVENLVFCDNYDNYDTNCNSTYRSFSSSDFRDNCHNCHKDEQPQDIVGDIVGNPQDMVFSTLQSSGNIVSFDIIREKTGLEEQNLTKILEKMKKTGIIFEPKNGGYKIL